ncbi:hypothetical protein BGW41_004239 [Actinomortierella wolfii]|nr:hypothetical protein BGW41_004239 [Actinomortierella wolfii]
MWAAASHKLRKFTQPAILVSSAVVGAGFANAYAQPIHCQRGEALELADTPYRPSPYSHHHFQERPVYRRQDRGGARVAKEEELVPAVLYIAGAGLIGSFLARKRNFVVRFVSPIALALGAAAYTVPKTTNNIIEGLKHYDYRLIGQEAEHKAQHVRESVVSAKNAVVGIAEGTASTVLGGFFTAETKAKEAVHDLEGQAHKLTDKAHHALEDIKDKSEDVAKNLLAKGEEAAAKAQTRIEALQGDAEASIRMAKDRIKSNAEDIKNKLPKDAESFKRSAQEAGREAKDWVKSHTLDSDDIGKAEEHLKRTGHEVRDGVERGLDRFRDRAHEGYRHSRRFMDDARDNADEALHRARHDFHRRWADARDKAEDWADQGRDRFAETERDWRRRAREGKDYVDDKLREGQQLFRDEYDRFSRSGPRFGTHGGWGRTDGYDQRSYGGYPGRDSYVDDRAPSPSSHYRSEYEPRRSVSEMAREEGWQSWARAKNAADPYESYDRASSSASSSSRPWWNTHSRSTSDYDRSRPLEESFQETKDAIKKNVDAFKSDVDSKMEEGRRWWHARTKDFEQGVEKAEEYGRKLWDGAEKYDRRIDGRFREGFEDQGRDIGVDGIGIASNFHGKGDYDHYYRHSGQPNGLHHPGSPNGLHRPSSINGLHQPVHDHPVHGHFFSDDNWFHYEPSHHHRRGERGI